MSLREPNVIFEGRTCFPLETAVRTLVFLAGTRPRTLPSAAGSGKLSCVDSDNEYADDRSGTGTGISNSSDADAQRALDPEGRYTDWQQEVAARSVLRLSIYQPGRAATRIRCLLLAVFCEADQSAYPPAALQTARRAPNAEVVQLPGGHYAPFLAAHEQAVEAEVAFLNRHLLRTSQQG
jgi:pimeloyl-ACP methyl ester carboxylesterase